jgi:prolipoprotein diacylglyceryltransferase
LTFFSFLIAYAAMRFFVTYLRVDSSEGVLGLRVPQIVSLVVILASLPGVWWYWRQPAAPDFRDTVSEAATAEPRPSGDQRQSRAERRRAQRR